MPYLMSPSPLVCREVRVTWHANGSVNEITYGGEPLLKAISNTLQTTQLTPQGAVLPLGFRRMIENLLDSIASLSDARRKILLADRVFGFQLNTGFPSPKLKRMVLEAILQTVWQWEDLHEIVHKGTIYYFIANTYLEQGDIPSAYIYFFSAIEEDKRNFPVLQKSVKEGGAYLTTSLVDNPQTRPHLYSAVVVPLRNYLQTFITEYNSRTAANLTMQEMDRKFLQADSLEDVKRFFVATIHEIYHLSPLNSPRMINNDYSKLKVIDTLFNLSLIVDQILEYAFLRSAPRPQRKMANAVHRLALHLNWTTATRDRNAGVLLSRVQPQLNSGPPDQIVPCLLDGSATFNARSLSSQKMAIFLAYHLRNFGGHHIKGQDILVRRYPEVLSAILDAVFTAIEAL